MELLDVIFTRDQHHERLNRLECSITHTLSVAKASGDDGSEGRQRGLQVLSWRGGWNCSG